MKDKKLISVDRITLLGFCLLMVGAIGFSFSCTRSEDEVVVFAAASLTEVLNEVKKRYESEYPAAIQYNFGGSQGLAIELSKGSPGDVFISAGTPPMKFLTEQSDVEISSTSIIAQNSLIVVTKSEDVELISYSSLLDLDLIAIADPNLAPAGFYAKQSLTHTGLWTGIQEKLVFAADVRAALNYVKSGNVDAAIVYMTDGLSEPQLKIRKIIPLTSYTNISYPIAVIQNKKSRLSKEFVDYLLTSETAQLFQSYGFR